MNPRSEKINNLLKELSGLFFNKENNRTSLITITKVTTSNDLKKGTIFISVLPTDKEKAALDFSKRKRKELREYLKKKLKTKIIPFIDIQIDQGEKNRQKIDSLLKE